MIPAALSDIYSLSSWQQIWMARSSGARRLEQHKHLGWQYSGSLDHDALETAWRALTERHEALRSAFFHPSATELVQIVVATVHASIAFHDLSGLDADQQEHALASLLEEDRQASFDLASPPLGRLLAVRIDDRRHRIVWSIHGPLVDSWSQPIVIKELFQIYDATVAGAQRVLPPPPRYGDFIAWRSRQAFDGAEVFWRRALDPFSGVTSVCDRAADPSAGEIAPEYADQVVPTNVAAFAALEAVGKARHLTLNALVMAAWAVVLARYCRTDFVVFGVTLSGRSPGVPGVERMVGYFMNVLPVAARLPRNASFAGWAQELQTFLLAVRQHEHLPAVLPATWCGGGAGPFLFDALFVFENYPVVTPGDPFVAGVDLRETQGIVVSTFPLTVIVSKGWEWLQMLYDASRVNHATVARLLRAFDACLQEVATWPSRRVVDVARPTEP